MKKVSVSFFSSREVMDDILELETTTADYIHVDVADGRFVRKRFLPHRLLRKMTLVMKKRLDVHLMVKKPKKYIEKYASLNTEYISVHIELEEDIKKYLDLIKSYGIKSGIAISPDTDINKLEPYLDDIKMILVMSVIPGKGGQSFIEDTPDRIAKIKQLIGERKILINVDGGINEETVSKVKDADIVVSGSYVINSDDYEERIKKLR